MQHPIIAIDGPAGSGKSTVAKEIALRLSCLYIDSGAMYRAATWWVLQSKIDPKDENSVVALLGKATIELRPDPNSPRQRVFVDGQEVTTQIRSNEVNQLVSPISAMPGVRLRLTKLQQDMAAQGGVVMDGRDIGTVVLPNADLKIFLTASPEVRAQRRALELSELGQEVDTALVLKDIRSRDMFDSTRPHAPLMQAPDAVLIDTDVLSIKEVVEKVLMLLSHKDFAATKTQT